MRPLCAFDLDHTLVRSPLDLAATRGEISALVAARGVTLPAGAAAWTIGQIIAAVEARDRDAARACWDVCEAHERRALLAAAPEPGAREALDALHRAGFPLAVWTNNVRVVAQAALARCELAVYIRTLVTRDEAPLKPDPAGLRLLEAAYPERRIWVVGDSWVDGAAAQAGGAPFIAYGADPADLARRGVAARVVLHDLRALPGWLLEAVG